MNKARLHIQGDRVIWMVVVFLTIFSLLAVYSSTRTMAFNQQGGGSFYLLKHVGIVLFGLTIMYAAHLVRYPVYGKISRLLLFAAILLLIYTFFRGASINEAKRWVIIPVINITFQTSDFAKLALTIFLARSLTLYQDRVRNWRVGFIPLLIPIIIVCVMILPANFSTAAILFASSIVLLYIGRAKITHILVLVGVGAAALTITFGVISLLPEDPLGRRSTWEQRMKSYSGGDFDEVYQVRQSKIAIASGGVFGRFPGNSLQRNFLPNPFSDFIYAIIIEEYGLIGGVIILILYLILLFRSIKIAVASPGTFGALLAVGLGFGLVFQAMINMAVAVGLVPVTGQPLPMISMGGTSIWFTSLSIGIMLSVSRETEIEKQNGENQAI